MRQTGGIFHPNKHIDPPPNCEVPIMSAPLIRGFVGLFALLIFLPLYFVPAILGWKKKNRTGILLLNLLAGWTLIGWIAAIIWAIVDQAQNPNGSPNQSPLAQPSPTHFCAKCGKNIAPGESFCKSCGAAIA